MTTAKLANYHSIIKDGKEVGKIQILNYYDSGVPQLEYDLDKEYWGKGIMTQELRKKLEKARFVNFYGNEIDLSLGKIKQLIHYNETTTISSDFDDDYEDKEYSILLKYDNFKERYLSYGQRKNARDEHIYELDNFANSDKFTQYLNNYENLKEEYEQLL